jgi:HlyD family secretion protein
MTGSMKRLVALLAVIVIAAIGWSAYLHSRPSLLVLTGIVTTNDVIVSPQIGGQIAELTVKEGDAVRKDQRLAVIRPDELRAETTYYRSTAAGLASQVRESEAALRFQERQTADQIRQAEAAVRSLEAQVKAAEADVEAARLTFTRTQDLAQKRIASTQELDQARTGYASAQAKVDSLSRQVDAQRAAVALARSNAEQVTVKRSQLTTSEHMEAAAEAQKAKADVRLRYTEILAPIDGIVDVRAVRQGEVVTPGQPIVTLINPDDLWVRCDVEETYIDRIRIGETMRIRLPSGDERDGTVFYRSVDASFATQRDVSRTKRDIKTFEIRLRVDNRDRRLAVGQSAYVMLPVS